MMKVFEGLLLALFFITYNTLRVLCIQNCTTDSCQCRLEAMNGAEVYYANPGDDIIIDFTLRLPKPQMDDLASNFSRVAFVTYDKDITRGYWVKEEYSDRLTLRYSSEPNGTGCFLLTMRVIIHRAELPDDNQYHMEVRFTNMTFTTRDQPWTVHVTPGQQQNETRGDTDVQVPRAQQDSVMNDPTGTENIQALFAGLNDSLTQHQKKLQDDLLKLNENLTQHQNKLQEDLLKLNDSLTQHQNILSNDLLLKLESLGDKGSPSPVNSPLQWVLLGISSCVLLMLALHLVVYWRRDRNVYAPVSNINVANVFSPGVIEMGQRNAAQGTVAETNSCAESQKSNHEIEGP